MSCAERNNHISPGSYFGSGVTRGFASHTLPHSRIYLVKMDNSSEDAVVESVPISPTESNCVEDLGVKKEEIAPSTKKGKRVLGKPKKDKFGMRTMCRS